MEPVSFLIAFAAGFLSFVSPCVLPLLPSYMSFITGLSIDQLTATEDRARVKRIVLTNSLLFIAGFSTIFIGLGASATLAGSFLAEHQKLVARVGGAVVVVFGLYVMGLIQPLWLSRDKRVHLQHKPKGYVGSYLVGMAFAAGWTPCVGPILGTILLMASTSGSMAWGIYLLTWYSLGLAVPFFITSLALNTFLARFAGFSRYFRVISILSGLFLVVVGLLIFFDFFTVFSSFLTRHGIGWTVEL
ncbi:MAG: cytochrome c biogenesis protein CcdA [Nitrospirota bacterium]|nr:cytochrome c biogenesis protein CcdA [Nitrospirota bacterium]